MTATAGLEETARSNWCREHGVFPRPLDAWKQDAIDGLCESFRDGRAAKHEQRRVTELKAELRRKDNPLAEPAAVLVLSKELQALFHDGEDT